MVARVEPAPSDDPQQRWLRIRGERLMRQHAPKVQIGGEPVSVLQANDREILIAPQPHQLSGILSIETSPSYSAEAAFDLRPAFSNGASKETEG